MKKEEFLEQSSTLLTEAFTSLLEKAYNAGYEQGKADQAALTQPVVVSNGHRWVDLSLPSQKRIAKVKHCIHNRPDVDPYMDCPEQLTLDDVNELFEYCLLRLRIDITPSTGTRWPRLEFVSTKGTVLNIYTFNYNSDPDGSVIDVWVNAPTNTEVKSSVLRMKVKAIKKHVEYKVDWEIVEGVFKGETAINLLTKEF